MNSLLCWEEVYIKRFLIYKTATSKKSLPAGVVVHLYLHTGHDENKAFFSESRVSCKALGGTAPHCYRVVGSYFLKQVGNCHDSGALIWANFVASNSANRDRQTMLAMLYKRLRACKTNESGWRLPEWSHKWLAYVLLWKHVYLWSTCLAQVPSTPPGRMKPSYSALQPLWH